jgi:hypothetical protein
MCCFCLFVKLELYAIAIRDLSCSLCGCGSHGFVFVMVPLLRERCSQIAVSHVFFSRCDPAIL